MTDIENHVSKKPDISVGGHRPVDVSGDQVKHAVDFVMKYLNSESDDLYSLELFQVVNGTQQVWLVCTTVYIMAKLNVFCCTLVCIMLFKINTGS